MTTRGKYNSIFNYRNGKKVGYLHAKREFYNSLSGIIDEHMEKMKCEIYKWRSSWMIK